jgi:anti-sigma B factor antagonist
LTPVGHLRWGDAQAAATVGGTEAARKGGTLFSERLQIRTTVTPRGITVITPVGELDHDSAPALEEVLTATGRLPCAVVDFSHITFADSTGITALLRANQTLRTAGGWLRLSSIPEGPLRGMQIVGVHHVIDVYPTLQAALQT